MKIIKIRKIGIRITEKVMKIISLNNFKNHFWKLSFHPHKNTSPYKSRPMIAERATPQIPPPDGIASTGQKKSSSSSSAALTKVIWILPSSIEMEPNRFKDVDNSAMSNSSSHQSQIVPIDEAITIKEKKINK